MAIGVGFLVGVVVPMSRKAAVWFGVLGGGAAAVVLVLALMGPKHDANIGLGLLMIAVLPVLGIGLGGGARLTLGQRRGRT